jgi:arylsulfatase A-like enzyme
MYQPVVRVPLLIFEPGRKTAAHIHTPTSAVDLLPTLLHVTGQKAADWTEGLILPPYADPIPGRSLYSMRSTKTEPNDPMSQVSAILVKEKYKLHYYFGYKDRDVDEMIQLYDIEADPEELNDLAVSRKDVADALLAEMKAKLVEVDKPYIK